MIFKVHKFSILYPKEINKFTQDSMKKLKYLKNPNIPRLNRMEKHNHNFFFFTVDFFAIYNATEKSTTVERNINNKNL